MADWFGKEDFKLGFGLMRLPKNADGSIDIPQVSEMVDRFLEAGGTYFDTAYVYEGSEEAVRKALVDRWPRERYTLATKLNAWLGRPDEQSAKKQLETSLQRTGAGYFDYYLLHSLQLNNRETYDSYGLWDFVREQKEKGRIRHWGFSFHSTPELLDELLTEHPDAEFVQLQLNYADWNMPEVSAAKLWEIARRHGKSIVVMEPVRGGSLASPPAKVAALLRRANPDVSPASWAIRFAASQEGILTVLSGMSTIGQMEDNLSYMRAFKPLDEREMETLREAQEILSGMDGVPCTGCRYCTHGCPREIDIPNIFRAWNDMKIYQNLASAKRRYAIFTGKAKASD